jgi:hypothetical protein
MLTSAAGVGIYGYVGDLVNNVLVLKRVHLIESVNLEIGR